MPGGIAAPRLLPKTAGSGLRSDLSAIASATAEALAKEGDPPYLLMADPSKDAIEPEFADCIAWQTAREPFMPTNASF